MKSKDFVLSKIVPNNNLRMRKEEFFISEIRGRVALNHFFKSCASTFKDSKVLEVHSVILGFQQETFVVLILAQKTSWKHVDLYQIW